MSKTPTDKQTKVLDYIKDYFQKHGISPTFRDIAVELGISVGTVQDNLFGLQNKGLLSWIPKKQRSITLRQDQRTHSTTPLSLLGTISAGDGIAVFEETDPEIINAPSEMLTYGFNHYCLKVSGFSMSEDGILDGDIIVVRQQATAQDGETVVAIIKEDGEEKANLKRFYHHGDKIELRPRNQQLTSKFYDPSQIEVRGKFRGLIRKEDL